MSDTTTAATAGDALDVLAAARKAMAQAAFPTLKVVLEKPEDIPLGKLTDVLGMLLPALPEGNVKLALTMMSHQLPNLPQLLKQGFAEAEKADA
jgi:FAD/FMN-containing dehydrogenase